MTRTPLAATAPAAPAAAAADVKRIYFMGIGGTGMAAVAGLCREAGFEVLGSDGPLYPPMSDMLRELNVTVLSPYAPANLEQAKPDWVVVANALSRGHVELEAAIASGQRLTSFPSVLRNLFLKDRIPAVVVGTHGKTTTTALVSHLLFALGEDPSFMVGGLPRNFPRSFRLGTGKAFVLEGDEYDTAFFDKGPKFLHYSPQFLVFNNCEYDHADIYPDAESLFRQFETLLRYCDDPRRIIANVSDVGVCHLLDRVGIRAEVTATTGLDAPALAATAGEPAVRVLAHAEVADKDHFLAIRLSTRRWGEISAHTTLAGSYNASNMAQAVGCVQAMADAGALTRIPTSKSLADAIAQFQGVRRRLELLGQANGVRVYEDFAHHPTAVGNVITAVRKLNPGCRIIAAFEPKNATSRRNTFHKEYVESLTHADIVLIGECPVDARIAPENRMDTQRLAGDLSGKAQAFATNRDLLAHLTKILRPKDCVLFMSSSSFSGIHAELTAQLPFLFDSRR